MKLKIRYEEKYETVEVNSDEMWVSLSLEGGENLTQEEKETMIQDAFEEKFNKPEYNNWHKFDRHRGNLKKQFRKDDEDADESDGLDTVGDYSQEEERTRKYEYEDLCQRIRAVLKHDFAEVIIAVCLDDMSRKNMQLPQAKREIPSINDYREPRKNFKNFSKTVQSDPLPRLTGRGSTSNKLQEVILMSELQIFKNAEFGSVRTIAIDGEPYFVGKDVAVILGYAKPLNALAMHVDEDDSLKQGLIDGMGRMQETIFINESGLYSLILSSKLPTAKKFKRWVTSEVLPAIRRHGIYAVDEVLNNPDMLIAALTELREERARTKALTETVAVQNQQIVEMKPKASYYDVVLNCKDLVAISVIAKDYGWSANHMNQYLHEKGVQYKQGNKIWLLYQKYAEMGYTNTKTHSYPGSDGSMHTAVHTYWTQAGRLFIYGLLKADGILPTMEQEESYGDR